MRTPLEVVIGSCEAAAALLSELADGEGHGLRLARARLHVALCSRCAGVVAELDATIEALRGLGRARPDPHPELVPAVIERIRRERR